MKTRKSVLDVVTIALITAIVWLGFCIPPALAWDTWPTGTNSDINHTWTVVFDHDMNTSTINGDNIYVSHDISGSSIVSGVAVSAADSTHAVVKPPSGGWNPDAAYYLIVTQKVLTSANVPLKEEVRMPFHIVVKVKETPTIDVTNDGTNISVKVNGSQLSCSSPPYIANGSTMVPFRPIAEALGAQVDWDSSKKMITIMGDKTIELTVNSKTAKVDGVAKTMDNPAVIKNGSTMVPLRFVGEALGAKVSYKSTANVNDSDQSVLNQTQAANVSNKATQADTINIAGGDRLEFKTEGDIQDVMRILKDRAVQLGYGDIVMYSTGDQTFCMDIIRGKLDPNQTKYLINIQRPVQLLSAYRIPLQSNGNNQPDEINISGGIRTVFLVSDETVSFEEVIRNIRERAAQLDHDGMKLSIYQLGEDRIVIDLWNLSGDPEAFIDKLRNDQVGIMSKTIIRKQG